MSEFAEGFILQLGIIAVLGSQNLFIIDLAVRRVHPFFAAFLSALVDTFLIFTGAFFGSYLSVIGSWSRSLLGFLGSLFMIYYGLQKLYFSRETLQLDADNGEKGSSLSQQSKKYIFRSALLFSLLNPHVLLDTLILIGGPAGLKETHQQIGYFASGASTMSWLWFFGLAYLGGKVGVILAGPKGQKVLLQLTGIIILLLGLKLFFETYAFFTNSDLR